MQVPSAGSLESVAKVQNDRGVPPIERKIVMTLTSSYGFRQVASLEFIDCP